MTLWHAILHCLFISPAFFFNNFIFILVQFTFSKKKFTYCMQLYLVWILLQELLFFASIAADKDVLPTLLKLFE